MLLYSFLSTSCVVEINIKRVRMSEILEEIEKERKY